MDAFWKERNHFDFGFCWIYFQPIWIEKSYRFLFGFVRKHILSGQTSYIEFYPKIYRISIRNLIR